MKIISNLKWMLGENSVCLFCSTTHNKEVHKKVKSKSESKYQILNRSSKRTLSVYCSTKSNKEAHKSGGKKMQVKIWRFEKCIQLSSPTGTQKREKDLCLTDRHIVCARNKQHFEICYFFNCNKKDKRSAQKNIIWCFHNIISVLYSSTT